MAIILSLVTVYLIGQFVFKITYNPQRKPYQLLKKAIRRGSAREVKIALKAINPENKTQRAKADKILKILNDYLYPQNPMEMLSENDRATLTQLAEKIKENKKLKRQENSYRLPPLYSN